MMFARTHAALHVERRAAGEDTLGELDLALLAMERLDLEKRSSGRHLVSTK
jgi:hypothetical protein